MSGQNAQASTETSGSSRDAAVPSFLGRSLPAGTLPILGGIPLRIHTLLIVYIFVTFVLSFAYGPLYAVFVLITSGIILFLTVLVHEIGHCWACKRVGGTIDSILLWPLGGLAFVGHQAGPKQDAFIAAMGPATHIPMAGFWLCLELAATGGELHIDYVAPLREHFFTNVFIDALWLQVLLFLFNLLVPAYPLDGGRILADVLLFRGVPPNKAATIVSVVSIPIAVILLGIGVWQLVVVGFNGFIMVFVACWVGFQAWQLFKLAQAELATSHPLFARAEATHQPEMQSKGTVATI